MSISYFIKNRKTKVSKMKYQRIGSDDHECQNTIWYNEQNNIETDKELVVYTNSLS